MREKYIRLDKQKQTINEVLTKRVLIKKIKQNDRKKGVCSIINLAIVLVTFETAKLPLNNQFLFKT